jgi:hypothetical protein
LDRGLSWGASLSAYQDVLTDPVYQTVEIFGIELTEDLNNLPTNYKRIDHHNEWQHLPASIEQVADLLNITLNRFETLVAANDKGYIPAMLALEATAEEIATIRQQDRAAQGVTPEDEVLARQAIDNKQLINGVTIVKTKSRKFSPIADLLFGTSKLIVYNNETLNYYGTGKDKVVAHFQEQIGAGQAYHGGGDKGFFGVVSGSMLAEDIATVVQNIVGIVGIDTNDL